MGYWEARDILAAVTTPMGDGQPGPSDWTGGNPAVADFGLQGFPSKPDAVDRITHYRNVLEALPPQFSTVWISDHLQFGDTPSLEGWTLSTDQDHRT